MMGERRIRQEALFYEFSLERHVPEKHLLRSIDWFVELDGLRQQLAPFYSGIRAAIGRSRASDSHADRWLLLRHPLGAAAVRGGAPQPGVSLVLSARARRRGAGSLDVLEEPSWPFPRQRSAAAIVRDCTAALHRRRPGRR